MAITVTFNGVTLTQPNVYDVVTVQPTSGALPQLGIMAIIGESAQGPSLADDDIVDCIWEPSQYEEIAAKYGPGAIADAALQAFNASNDPDIQGGAQALITLKTNASVPASVILPAASGNYGVLSAKLAGTPGNNLTSAVTSVGGQVVFTVIDTVQGIAEISGAIGGVHDMTIQVAGSGVTAATMTINATTLSTTVTGGTNISNLSIPLAQFATLQQLVTYINAQNGYTCTVNALQQSFPPSVMDQVSAVGIFGAPYSVLQDAYDVATYFSSSQLANFAPTATGGLPIALSTTYLSGGALGGTSQSAITAALAALQTVDCDFVVPLFSQDSTDDIEAGVTDPSSSYSIAAIQAGVLAHCNLESSMIGQHERQGVLSNLGTFAAAKAAALNLGAARVKMFFQQVDTVQSGTGSIVLQQPWMLAVSDAAMKCAAVVGLSNLFKQVNIQGFSVPDNDFNPSVDNVAAIQANLAFVGNADGGGYHFMIDNSTYGQVTNAWIYNRPAVIYAGDIVAQSLRLSLQIFLGKRNSDITPQTIANAMTQTLDQLRIQGVIVGDTNTAGKGYKNLKVKIVGNVVSLNCTVALVENIEFELLTINVQRAQLS